MQYFNTCRKIVYLKNGIDETEYSPEVYKRQEKLDLYRQLRSEGCVQKTALKAIGISRATCYRWEKQYVQQGLVGLEVKDRTPLKVRQPKWNSELEKQVCQLRKKWPLYGKYKLAVILARDYQIKVSASTIGRILKKLLLKELILPVHFYYGHVKTKKKRVFNKHAKRWKYGMEAKKPGEMIQVDHLVVTLEPGYRVRHFTATCPITRLTVEQAYSSASSRSASKFLDYMQEHFPFSVSSVQVDGGSEFMAEFEDSCENLNIELYVLPPRSPELNGKVERRNGTARYEFYALYNGPPQLEKLRGFIKKFMHLYNTFRPHQALQYQTPWQYYQSLGA